MIKPSLSPQEEKEIEIILNAKSFSEWSLDKKEWEIKKGSYKIHIGASSEDIRLIQPVQFIDSSFISSLDRFNWLLQ